MINVDDNVNDIFPRSNFLFATSISKINYFIFLLVKPVAIIHEFFEYLETLSVVFRTCLELFYGSVDISVVLISLDTGNQFYELLRIIIGILIKYQLICM